MVRPLLRGLILSAPALYFDAEVDTPTNRLLAGTLSAWLPKLPVQRLNPDRLSTDPVVVEAYLRDPLVYTGPLRVRTGAEFMKAVDAALALVAHADTETVPTLVVHGEADLLCDPRGSHNYVEAVASNPRYRTATPGPASLRMYPGLKHELFNERADGRRAVMADLLAWVAGHISAVARGA
jgi:acylglycerol lipase